MLDAQTLADRYVAVWNERRARRRGPSPRFGCPMASTSSLGARRKAMRSGRSGSGSHEKNVRIDGNRFRAARGARLLRNVVKFYGDAAGNGDTVLARGLKEL